MKDVYEVAGISKQAVHQHAAREMQAGYKTKEIFEQASKMRITHPGTGCRKMALDMVCKGWGRDKIENLLLKNGYRLYYRPNYIRTTRSQHELYFPNRIEGLEVTNINQVVQTDITYYRGREKFYYLVFIIDVYSRRIVGYAASKTLEAEGNIKALKQMLKTRRHDNLTAMIHHSDRGGQYIDKEYLAILNGHQMTISMCDAAWKNAYAERVNRTIKEEYLDRWEISSFVMLTRLLKKAVDHYNHSRRHKNLNWQTPIQFEKNVKNIPLDDRIKMKLYKQLDSYSQDHCVY